MSYPFNFPPIQNRIGENLELNSEEIPPLSIQFPQLANPMSWGQGIHPSRIAHLSIPAEPPLVLTDPIADHRPSITHLHQPLLIAFNQMLVDLSANHLISEMIDQANPATFTHLPILGLFYLYSNRTADALSREIDDETIKLILSTPRELFREKIERLLTDEHAEVGHDLLYRKLADVLKRISREELV